MSNASSTSPSSFARRALLTLLFAGAAALPLVSSAAGFPSAQPIRLVVPYAPGGTADILARELGQHLSRELGQTVVVDNRAGAGTAIGARHVAEAAPDGYTLFMGTSTSHGINPATRPQIGYDPLTDFTALAAIGEVPYAVVAHPSSHIGTLQDLIDASKKSEKPLSYSSAGVGSANHLAGVLLTKLTGREFLHVPYQGSAPALNALLANQVDFMFDLVTTSQSHVANGSLSALATTADQRAAALPKVATTAEAALPELVVTSWFGVFAPAGLPQDVQGKLEATLGAVLAQADVQDRLKSLGLALMEQRGAAFGELVRHDYEHWAAVVKDAGLTLEN